MKLLYPEAIIQLIVLKALLDVLETLGQDCLDDVAFLFGDMETPLGIVGSIRPKEMKYDPA